MVTTLMKRLTSWLTAAMLVTSFGLAVGMLSFVLYARANDCHSHVVLTGSMVPTLPVGSLVVTSTTSASELRVGDIITFHPANMPGALISHRIIAVVTETGPTGSQRYFLTKGDANPVRDSWRVPATGSIEEERFDVPYVGYLTVWLQSGLGRLLFLIGPAVLLAGIFMVEIWTSTPAPRPTPAAR